MNSKLKRPLVLEPNFQKKKRRENFYQQSDLSFGTCGSHVGFLDLDGNVIVDDDASVAALQKEGCYGDPFPQSFSRRTKGTAFICDEIIRTASEVRDEMTRQGVAPPDEGGRNLSRNVPDEPRVDVQPRQKLKLRLEEALYLAHDLHRLEVFKDCNKQDSIESLQLFQCGHDRGVEFARRFAVYRYYRSKGWIVKDGEAFGVDYVLYKSNPEDFHSTYGVRISSPRVKLLDWRRIACLCRTLSRVSKELIICNVDCNTGDQSITLANLDRFVITEMHVKPWFARHQYQRQTQAKELAPNFVDTDNDKRC